MRAIFDTGSSNTWIIGKKAVLSDPKFDFSKSYDEKKSSTFKKPKERKNAVIPFGVGKLEGHFVTDTLSLGDSNGKKITIPNMEFGIVESSKGIFENP